MSGQLTRSDELSAIVDSFQPGIVHAIGYGSGVFVQQSSTPEQPGGGAADHKTTSPPDDQPMIDLILTVSDSKAFHRHMLELFPDHYSALARVCGPTFCTNLQRSERYGAGVYFNPLVESPVTTLSTCANSSGCKRKIKYGIVQTEDLVDDLMNWRWLYLAGRMQKPTVNVDGLGECDRIALAQKQNLDMAVAASLLLLGGSRSSDSSAAQTLQTYPLTSLFEQIAGLSYAGDPRMDVGGEDPDKVSKLVRSDGQEGRFYDLYKQSMANLQDVGVLDVVGASTGSSRLGTVAIDLDDDATRRHLWKSLPKRVNQGTCYGEGIETRQTSAQYLSKCLVDIVRPAARKQSLKGVLTAGIVKSVQYAAAKFAKGAFRSS